MKKTVFDIMNHEYLLTNGLGGYSFGTVDGTNCRKYHGLFCVSDNPPVERFHLISKMVVSIVVGDNVYPFVYENVTGIPKTESNLTAFDHKGTLQRRFHEPILGADLKEQIGLAYGSNHLAAKYKISLPETLVHRGDVKIKFELLVNFRDHHETITPDPEKYTTYFNDENQMAVISDQQHTVYAQFVSDESVTYRFPLCLTEESYYPIETERGYPDIEAHIVAVEGTITPKSNTLTIELRVNTASDFRSLSEIHEARTMRYEQLMKSAGAESDILKQLVQASDDFIVYRKTTGKKTIIAGYPWFTDWGRDTMISIPGLTLETGRYEEAFEMIEGFLQMAHKGIIPNNFPDEGQAPMYNTSDGTLWLFHAMYQYMVKTNHLSALEKVYPKLVEIIDFHVNGTINDIYMDQDGLLSTGNETTQLTWMDVKVNGWVVTPRHGKAVEINALWYNALQIMAAFSTMLSNGEEHKYLELSSRTKSAFNEQFWNEAGQNLYDLIIDGKAYDIPRPNMIFAVSLPFSVLNLDRHKAVVDYVMKHFKTPYGLRTLRTDDENFHPIYTGDLLSRDGAYHRGTVWAWLMGPYLEAHYKTYKDLSYLQNALKDWMMHLENGVIGSLSEVFDATEPFNQKGCSAQAWSVAEAIRIWKMANND